MIKKKSKLIGSVFALLFLVQLGFLLHAYLTRRFQPDVIVSASVLVLIGVIYWISYLILRKNSWGIVVLLAIGTLLVSVYESYFPFAPLGALWKQRGVNGVTLSNYQETYRLSKRGNPIGIRISYDVVFPVSGSYHLNTELQAINPVLQHYNLQLVSISPRLRIEPRVTNSWWGGMQFESGTVYHLVEEIKPVFLVEAIYDEDRFKQGDLCIVEQESESLSAKELRQIIETDAATRHTLLIEVRSNNYLVTSRTILNRQTAEYMPRTFLLSAKKERAPTCVPDSSTGWPKVKTN